MSETKSVEEIALEAAEKAHPFSDGERVTFYNIVLSAIQTALAPLQSELERERMCHAACGVIANSNTEKSLAENRQMLPEYLSASVQDCIRAAEREIAYRDRAESSEYNFGVQVDVTNYLCARLAAAEAALKAVINSTHFGNAYDIAQDYFHPPIAKPNDPQRQPHQTAIRGAPEGYRGA